jgi:LmbE family N-acetylglucosaminyl deacetylase
MKKILAIFAHPDDEAFGPSGTIALLSQTHEISIIIVTSGESGKCALSEIDELKDIRHEEMKLSAKILGVKNIYFLGYKDGQLSNSLYHTIAQDLEKYIKKLKPDTLLTFEHRGFVGHIDHVAVTLISSYVFEKISSLKRMMYFCMSEESRALQDPYFIYIPPGYKKSEINEIYDVSEVWDRKLASMKAHESQTHDYERFTKVLEQLPKEEYFLIKNK